MLLVAGYRFADGNIVVLTPVQQEMVMWAHVLANGGKVPRPYITEDEYEKSLSRKSNVKEFSEAMKKAQEIESTESYDELRAKMERKAQEMGITEVY